jgi:hypothetical protein
MVRLALVGHRFASDRPADCGVHRLVYPALADRDSTFKGTEMSDQIDTEELKRDAMQSARGLSLVFWLAVICYGSMFGIIAARVW